MTREEAIEYWELFNSEIDDLLPDTYGACKKALEEQREAVEFTIAALREQREGKMEWISVRDRLPEEKEPVIILLQDGQVFRGEIRERILLPEWWYYYDAGDTDMDMLGHLYYVKEWGGSWCKSNPVIAWMPMPEPPKEEKKA